MQKPEPACVLISAVCRCFSISGIKGATTLIVYSFNGQKQIEQSMNQTESVDISNLPNGTYVVVVQNKEGVFREKLVVQR